MRPATATTLKSICDDAGQLPRIYMICTIQLYNPHNSLLLIFWTDQHLVETLTNWLDRRICISDFTKLLRHLNTHPQVSATCCIYLNMSQECVVLYITNVDYMSHYYQRLKYLYIFDCGLVTVYCSIANNSAAKKTAR